MTRAIDFEAEDWKCPKCGASGDDIECTSFVLADKPEVGGLRKIVPKKIWCMVCGKEYLVTPREKVKFT